MNDVEWNELQRVWKSGPPPAAPVAAELERLGRGRRWAAAGIAFETAIALAGIAFAVWTLTRAGAFHVVTGIATLMFVAVTCALSFWARRVPQSRADDPVRRALGAARRHAQVSVRLAAATIWALIGGVVFAAAMLIARATLTANATLAGYGAAGVILLFVAAWLALAFRHYRRRSADLVKLDALAAELDR
jgi:hypothetical protein